MGPLVCKAAEGAGNLLGHQGRISGWESRKQPNLSGVWVNLTDEVDINQRPLAGKDSGCSPKSNLSPESAD